MAARAAKVPDVPGGSTSTERTMTDDSEEAAGGSRRYTTTRPLYDPVVIALSSDDPQTAFVEHVRERLDPGQWHRPIDLGFEWTAHRLPHTVQCFHDEDGKLIATSTITLVEEPDLLRALMWAGYLNQRSFGGVVWYDSATSTLRVTAAAHLEATSWWNGYLFASVVPRLVGICERLAPRLANWSHGRTPAFTHPDHGLRESPDQLVDEWMLDTYAPEAGLGLWWSSSEINAFRRVLRDAFAPHGATFDWPTDEIENCLLSRSMGGTTVIPQGEGRFTLRLDETDHPDLGLGAEILLSSSVQFPDAVNEDNPTSINGLFTANYLNAILATYSPAPLTLAGWTLWDNQLHLATYVSAEVIRMLQTVAQPSVGEVIASIARDTIRNAEPLPHVLETETAQGDFDYDHVDTVNWRGVNQNAGTKSLLVDDADVTLATVAGLPLNTLFAEPIELEGDVWGLQHSKLIMSMGIFNPVGPSIGTIELAIDYNLQRGLLLERTRHPHLPSLRLWAVVDRDGFTELPAAIEAMIEQLNWSTFEWARIHDPDDQMIKAIERGLAAFAARSSVDARSAAQALADGADDPWIRLDGRYQPSGTLDDITDVSAEELWVEIVTNPLVEDGARAYIRSAWQGAKAFIDQKQGPAVAEQWVTRIHDEIAARRTERS